MESKELNVVGLIHFVENQTGLIQACDTAWAMT